MNDRPKHGNPIELGPGLGTPEEIEAWDKEIKSIAIFDLTALLNVDHAGGLLDVVMDLLHRADEAEANAKLLASQLHDERNRLQILMGALSVLGDAIKTVDTPEVRESIKFVRDLGVEVG